MDPLPTLDLLLSDPAADPGRMAAAAASAVAAALADQESILAFDRDARATDWHLGERSVAATVFGQYEAWVAAAVALQERVAAVTGRAGPVAGADRLRPAIARARARVAVPIADLAAAVRDGQEGREHRFASMEEMRRELLHPDIQRHGRGAVPPARAAVAGGGA